MKKHTFKEKFQYHFDNLMSRGTASLIGILFAITALVVILAGVLTVLITGEGSVGKSMWMSLMHAIDAGTLAGDEGGWLFLALMAVVTICGLFITSMLIGVLNAGIEEKMTSLQKGKSQVLEKNHVVLLGFNGDALNILSELILANENHKHQVVVVMDEQDKTSMEDIIHQNITDTKTTKIICRSGRIDSFTDLSMCSLETCRSIILNVNEDSRTIKAIMACVNMLEKCDNRDAYITAMIRNEDNIQAAKIAGGDRVELLYFKRTFARLMANASRQPGISTVFTNLLSYDGDEIYVEALEGAEGHTVEELNLMLPNSTVIGIAGKGESKINPPKDTKVQPGEKLILVEEDDGVSHLSASPVAVDRKLFSDCGETQEGPQRSLILGHSEMLPMILEELDHYVADGSISVIASPDWEGQEDALTHLEMQHLKIERKTCDIFDIGVLEELLSEKPENVLILTNPDCEDEDADAQALLLLLQMSNIAEKNGLDFTVASEMRKVENQEFAKLTKVNDFVVGSNITALMMTQISQTREQRMFLEDLLDEDGSEFYRKPISRYVKCGVPVDFYTLVSAAARYGEVAFGYQIVKAGNKMQTICNPDKSQKITFTEDDALIVIAED